MIYQVQVNGSEDVLGRHTRKLQSENAKLNLALNEELHTPKVESQNPKVESHGSKGKAMTFHVVFLFIFLCEISLPQRASLESIYLKSIFLKGLVWREVSLIGPKSWAIVKLIILTELA